MMCYNVDNNFKKGDTVLNKEALISAIAEKGELNKRDAERALNAFTSVLTDALAKGERVQLVNFGTFEVRDRKARTGRNPQTKEIIAVPPTRVPVFHAGAGLKAAVAAKK